MAWSGNLPYGHHPNRAANDRQWLEKGWAWSSNLPDGQPSRVV
jgi:hypothetical protein